MAERVRQHKIIYPDGSTFPRDNKFLFKSETVWYIVRAYSNKHSYDEIVGLFNPVRDSDGMGRGYQNDCIMKENDVPENLMTRFNMDRVITSEDGVRFVVNTNWGTPVAGDKDCWQAFISAAKKAGYTVV